MFSSCNSLTELKISQFDTSKVLTMNDLFKGCNQIKFLNLSNFDTSKVTDMSGMFSSASLLTSINLESFEEKLDKCKFQILSCSISFDSNKKNKESP